MGTVSLVFRKSGSHFRYWLWSIVVLRICIPVQIKLPFSVEDVTRHMPSTGFDPAVVRNTLAVFDPASSGAAFHFPVLNSSLLVAVWLGTVAVLILYNLSSLVYLHHTLKKSTPIGRKDFLALLETLRSQMHIKPEIKLYYMNADSNSGPAVLGILRPRIFLPHSTVESWTADELHPILVHELVHIKRHDQLFNWLQALIQAFYFFHPLVWYANWKTRHYREESCDDISIHYLDYKVKKYTECIFNSLQEAGSRKLWGLFSIGFSEKRNSIARRIVRILDKEYQVNIRISLKMALGLGSVSIMSLFISCNSIVGFDESTSNDLLVTRGVSNLAPLSLNDSKKTVIDGYHADIYLSIDNIIFLYGKETSVEELKEKIPEIYKEAALVRMSVDRGADTKLLDSVSEAVTKNGNIKLQIKFK